MGHRPAEERRRPVRVRCDAADIEGRAPSLQLDLTRFEEEEDLSQKPEDAGGEKMGALLSGQRGELRVSALLSDDSSVLVTAACVYRVLITWSDPGRDSKVSVEPGIILSFAER